MAYQIDRLAFHYVDKKTECLRFAVKQEETATMDPIIVKFLMNRAIEVRDAEESKGTSAARFTPEADGTAGPPVAKECIGKIISGEGDYFELTKTLAKHLYDQSPGQASPGLLAVMRLIDSDNSSISVVILKLSHKDEDFVRTFDDSPTQLKVEHLKNLLEKAIQKGIVFPHPDKPDYDLKVIDLQVTKDEPAQYFTKFLGCWAKKSDEHQVRTLLPTVEQYAKERTLPLNRAKLPSVVCVLQEQGKDITTCVLAKAIKQQEILGPGFDTKDFVTYMEKSALGSLDIPIKQFSGRGKGAKKAREVTYRFKDPKYRNLRISGPPELFNDIISIQGDSVDFRVRTTKDGFEVEYA